MSVFKNEPLQQEYLYDFDVDGGAQGSIDLSAKAGYQLLPSGAIIEHVYSVVETACTSGGAATVSWGDGSDVDGYSGTAKAVAALVLDAVFEGKADSGALVPSKASNQAFSMQVATADLTAGKIRFVVKYHLPGRDS